MMAIRRKKKIKKILESKEHSNVIIKYILPKDIIRIHDKIIERFGGTKGIINTGAIDFIVENMLSRFNKEEIEDSIIKKATLLLFELVSQHPFIDGNKRTGFAVCEEFLNSNGYSLNFTTDEAEDLAYDIGKGKKSKTAIEKWIRKHLEKIKPNE